MYKIANMLSTLFDIGVTRWPRGSGRGRVPAYAGGRLLPAGSSDQCGDRGAHLGRPRTGEVRAALTRDLASHLWARGGKGPGVHRRVPCLARKAKPVSVGLQTWDDEPTGCPAGVDPLLGGTARPR